MDLAIWFAATETVIRHRAAAGPWGHITSDDLSSALGIAYASAHRLRRIVIDDLAPDGNGLLRAAVCTEQVIVPSQIIVGSERHLHWLLAARSDEC